jgi:hypothetical protein
MLGLERVIDKKAEIAVLFDLGHDRAAHYNAALWKQTAQTLFLLHAIRRH